MLSEMITETQQNEQHNISGGFFNDALSWLLDKVPLGNWLWPVGAAQGALKAHKGDSINEVDEEYARLVGASYEDSRPYTLDHWRRQTQFDSEYISVWDNLDGHRLIAVRGTAGPQDIGQDILVGLTGHSTDRIGAELRQILDATPEDSIVDLAAHSLGSSLALEAYNSNREIYNRVHETYLYNRLQPDPAGHCRPVRGRRERALLYQPRGPRVGGRHRAQRPLERGVSPAGLLGQRALPRAVAGLGRPSRALRAPGRPPQAPQAQPADAARARGRGATVLQRRRCGRT